MEENTVNGMEERAVAVELNPQVVVENQATKTKNVRGLILPLILLVAVAVLYVLFFTKKEKAAASPIIAASGGSSGLVLTVNNDSIVEQFVLYEILKSDLEKETERYRTDLQSKSAKLQEKARVFSENYQNNILTQTQIQNAQRTLQEEQAMLEELNAKYTEIMSKKEMSVHREIMDSIINATKRVNDAKYKADYVFATSEGSAIICSNPAYDITKEVIEELNNAYNKTHKK
jgi:Skp family chaperone for outer membrane proteins